MWYVPPDFTGLFLLAAAPALAVYAIGGVRWIALGKRVRIWRALCILALFPAVAVVHAVIAVMAVNVGAWLLFAWILGAPGALFWFWAWLGERPRHEAPAATGMTRLNRVGIAGFALIAALLAIHWYGPVLAPPPPATSRASLFVADEVPAISLSLDPMTADDVRQARAGIVDSCAAWIFREAGGRWLPVAVIARDVERGLVGDGAVKLNKSLRAAQPWYFSPGEANPPEGAHAAGFTIYDFTAMSPGPAAAQSFPAHLGLSFTSEDLQVVTKRTWCIQGFGRCRRYEGHFTATWTKPRQYTETIKPRVAAPESIPLMVEDPCIWQRGSLVEPRNSDGFMATVVRLLYIGP